MGVKRTLQYLTNGRGSLVSRISSIIVTHADADHYNRLSVVLTTQPPRLQKIFLGGTVGEYQIDKASWVYTIAKGLFNGGDQCFGDACTNGNGFSKTLCGSGTGAPQFKIVAANIGGNAKGASKNGRSVVLRIDYAGESALLVGDLNNVGSVKAMETLVNGVQPGELHVTYYKVS